MTEEGKRKANKIGWIIILALVALLIAGIVAGEIIKYEERNRPPYVTVVKMYDAYTGEELGRVDSSQDPDHYAYCVLEEPVYIRADDPRTPTVKYFYIDKRGNEQELAPIMEKDPKRFDAGYLFHFAEVDENIPGKVTSLGIYYAEEPYVSIGTHVMAGRLTHHPNDYAYINFRFRYDLEII